MNHQFVEPMFVASHPSAVSSDKNRQNWEWNWPIPNYNIDMINLFSINI